MIARLSKARGRARTAVWVTIVAAACSTSAVDEPVLLSQAEIDEEWAALSSEERIRVVTARIEAELAVLEETEASADERTRQQVLKLQAQLSALRAELFQTAEGRERYEALSVRIAEVLE